MTDTAPRQVERPSGPAGSGLGHESRGRDHEGHADGDVDEEDPSPRRELGQHPAQQQPHGAAAGRDRAPDRQRLRAVVRRR